MHWSKSLLCTPPCVGFPSHQQLSTVTLLPSWLHVPEPHTPTTSLGAPVMNPSIFPHRTPRLFHWDSKSGSGLHDSNKSSAFQPGPQLETPQSPRFPLLHTYTFVSYHYLVPPSAPWCLLQSCTHAGCQHRNTLKGFPQRGKKIKITLHKYANPVLP